MQNGKILRKRKGTSISTQYLMFEKQASSFFNFISVLSCVLLIFVVFSITQWKHSECEQKVLFIYLMRLRSKQKWIKYIFTKCFPTKIFFSWNGWFLRHVIKKQHEFKNPVYNWWIAAAFFSYGNEKTILILL